MIQDFLEETGENGEIYAADMQIVISLWPTYKIWVKAIVKCPVYRSCPTLYTAIVNSGSAVINEYLRIFVRAPDIRVTP